MNDVSTSWGEVPNGFGYPRVPNVVYLLPIFDVSSFSMTGYINFQTDHFANFEQFKIDSHFANFGQVWIDPTRVVLLTLRMSVILMSLSKTGCEKQSKTSPFDKKIGPAISHFQSFSQQQSRTGCVPQLINTPQRLNVLFLSVTLFSNVCDKIKYPW